MPLRLPRRLRDRVLDEARREAPRECCGLLGGRREGSTAVVESVHPLPNVAEDPLGFRADAAAQRAALLSIEAAGREWIGTYHAHVADVAAPSGADLEAAGRGPADRFHLVVSLLDPRGPRLAAYRVAGGREVAEEVVVEDPVPAGRAA